MMQRYLKSLKTAAYGLAALLMAVSVLSGCNQDQAGGPSDQAASDAAAPASQGADTPDARSPRSVSGVITFDGERPERVELMLSADPKCSAMHPDAPLLSEREIVGEDGGIANCFVYVKDPPEGDYAVPEQAAKIDQVGCTYVPHVMGLRAGQKIDIHNSDKTMHNVRSFARKNRPFNLGQPKVGVRTKTFENAENAVKMKCDIHPWMTGYIFVMEHPYYAVTDERGAYSIPDVPAGDYTLTVWHETYGEKEIAISIKDGAVSDANATYSK